MIAEIRKTVLHVSYAWIVFLLIFPAISLSQEPCRYEFSFDGKSIVESLTGLKKDYYRNLLLQDIVLAENGSISETMLTFDYRLTFNIEKCNTDHYEIKLMPATVKCNPLKYRGFDISTSISPEKVNVVFYVFNQFAILTDSLTFLDLAIGNDSSLYVSKLFHGGMTESFTFRPVRLDFIYDERSYERYREMIQEIDHYYAAIILADSLLHWDKGSFFNENASFPSLLLQQFEFERLVKNISSYGFDSTLDLAGNDPGRLIDLMDRLGRKKLRRQTLLMQSLAEFRSHQHPVNIKPLAYQYIDWLTYYYQISSTADHRYTTFFSNLAVLDMDNGQVFHLSKILGELTGLRPSSIISRFTDEMKLRARLYSASGDDMKAIDLYRDAIELKNNTKGSAPDQDLFAEMDSAIFSVIWSYLDISARAAGKDNPGMCYDYLRKAGDLLPSMSDEHFASQIIMDNAGEMIMEFVGKANTDIADGKFRQSLNYLEVARKLCTEYPLLKCPEDISRAERDAQQGVYTKMAEKAWDEMMNDEITEADRLNREAIVYRELSGYYLTADPHEKEICRSVNQANYDDFISDGIQYLKFEEYDIALFYFEKAKQLEGSGLMRENLMLDDLIRSSARPVILRLLSDGRTKAWGYYIEDGRNYLDRCRFLVTQYQLESDTTLANELASLEDQLFNQQCERARDEFGKHILVADREREKENFILALRSVNRAIEESLSNSICRIDDSKAWYERVFLEPLADFQEKEETAMELLKHDYPGFVDAFLELERYYYENRLGDYRLKQPSLEQLVQQQDDVPFLLYMTRYYADLRQYDLAMIILKKVNGYATSKERVRNIQERLAARMAERDYAAGVSDPSKQIKSYTGNDKWFSFFTSEYKMVWLKESGYRIKYFFLFLK